VVLQACHCEERSDEAIQLGGSNLTAPPEFSLDCFASLAMTVHDADDDESSARLIDRRRSNRIRAQTHQHEKRQGGAHGASRRAGWCVRIKTLRCDVIGVTHEDQSSRIG
jgi:hypothetical protein